MDMKIIQNYIQLNDWISLTSHHVLHDLYTLNSFGIYKMYFERYFSFVVVLYFIFSKYPMAKISACANHPTYRHVVNFIR